MKLGGGQLPPCPMLATAMRFETLHMLRFCTGHTKTRVACIVLNKLVLLSCYTKGMLNVQKS